MAGPNTNFDEMSAMIHDWFEPKHREIVFNEHPILTDFHKQGSKPRGGNRVSQTLTYQFTKDGFYTDYEPGNTANEDKFTRARSEWKLARQHFTISVPELMRASGPEEVFDILENGTTAARRAIMDSVAEAMLFYDNTASPVAWGDSDEAVHSISRLLGDNTYPVASDTVLEIPKLGTYWRGNIVDAGGDALAAADINKLWYKCVDGNFHLNKWLFHNDQGEKVDNLTDTKERYISSQPTQMAKDQFVIVGFLKGQPVFVDRHMPTGSAALAQVIGLRSEDFDLVSHKDRNFRFEGFKEPHDQDVRVGWFFWMGALMVRDPRRSGLIKNFI
jgi:hypothetical protein